VKAYAIVPAAPGQQAWHALQHGRLSDQAQARRPAARLPHHSRARERRICPARGLASQHLPGIRQKLLDAQLRLRAEPRLRFAGQMTGCEGLCGIRKHWFDGRPLRPRPMHARRRWAPAAGHERRWDRCSATITGGHIETIDAGQRSFQPRISTLDCFRRSPVRRQKSPMAPGCVATTRPLRRSRR